VKAFVTGVGGFLGSHLAEALRGQYVVDGNDSLVCGSIDNVPEGVAFYDTDCRDFDGMRDIFDDCRPDVLIHAAATASEGFSVFSPSFITKNIYEASVATFSAAIANGVKRIVFMSSMARYGMNALPFTEQTAPRPVDPYGCAKVAAEQTLRILCETHNVKYSILVPHNIIGINQKYDDPTRNVVSIMINRVLQGKPIIVYGKGDQTRCFSPVEDCIPPILRAVHGAADGEVVNIGPDSGAITIIGLAQHICRRMGVKEEIVHVGPRPTEVKHAYCSSDKSRRMLGYKEQQSLWTCIDEMIEDLRLKGPKDFVYDYPIEISEGCPATWKERLL
jgi:UDP-glucose 4-epimerase